MRDYSEGKIYKILNTIDDEIYVGSTMEKLSTRMKQHRSCTKHGSNYKIYQHMRDIGVDKFYIKLIENCPCSSIEELLRKEGEWIRKIGTLNKIISGRSEAEYWKENKDKRSDKIRTYRNKHNDYLLETLTCRFCGNTYCRKQISRHEKSMRCIEGFIKY